jgi:hypothetical protein
MSPSDLILSTLRTFHRGKARAITREALRDYLRQVGHEMGDRDLRECYSTLPVCSCPAGIFYPETTAELEECREYYRKAALSLLGRWRRIAQAHPELININQMELF